MRRTRELPSRAKAGGEAVGESRSDSTRSVGAGGRGKKKIQEGNSLRGELEREGAGDPDAGRLGWDAAKACKKREMRWPSE